MFLTDHDVEDGAGSPHADAASSTAVVVAGTAVKALLAASAGLVLTCGLGLLVWAVTPSSGDGPLPLIRAGIAGFCAANGMTLEIGRSGLTLHPLMLTLVVVALLTSVGGRGRVTASGRDQESAAVGTAALVYAMVVSAIGAGFGGGTVSAVQWWRPALLALVIVGTTTLIRGDGWRPFLLARLPVWVPVSVRCGTAATAALLGGGAITLVIGLVRTFGDSITVQSLAAPGAAGGLGMALLGIAYLPNAVVAATGYSTGAGFTIGSGTYTPFGSSPVELPAVSLLTAAPDGHHFARPTLLLLLFPVLAAALIGRAVVGRLDTRNDRLFAALGAALLAAVLSVVLAEVAAGGVTGGEWSTTGVPPALFGSVVFAALGVIGAAVVVAARVPTAASVADAGEAGYAEDLETADATDPVDGVVPEPEADADAEADAEPDADAEPEADAECEPEGEIREDPDPVATGSPDEVPEEESADLEEPADDDVAVSEIAAQEVAVAETVGGTGEVEQLAETGEVEPTDQSATGNQDAAVSAAIPSPREEDVVAQELSVGDDPDTTLISGLPRRAKPGRTG